MSKAKKSVVLTKPSRGLKVGDVLGPIDSARADELIASGLARAPRKGEVQAAKDEGSSK